MDYFNILPIAAELRFGKHLSGKEVLSGKLLASLFLQFFLLFSSVSCVFSLSGNELSLSGNELSF